MSSLQSTLSFLLPSSTHNKKIAITNVDSWLGCCIAVHLAEKLEKRCPNVQIIALTCKDADSHLDKLKKFKNVHIHKIDYNDEKSIERAISGAKCALLLPEMTEHRVKHAKNVLAAMKKEKIKGCLMLSVEGAEIAENHGLKEIKSFHEIEKMVEEYCSCYLILRKSILNQCFLLWSPIVQEKQEFPMSCTAECQMAPLDACDLVCAIETVIVEHCRHDDDHNKGNPRDSTDTNADAETDESGEKWNFGGIHKNKKYILTGPHKITAQGLVQVLNEETGQRVQFKQVPREELKKYFESLKERENWYEDLSIDRCCEMMDIAVAGGDDMHEDHDHHHMAPNQSVINLMLDELELVKKGEVGFVSGDLEKIIGHQGRSVKDFMHKYKDEFRSGRL
ncbi:hypothetical protein BGZ95_004264 [Linnemannia exigua]|uniref:NAD(P)-binding domain-containing protein n=1 Tax=Linnemannia exigua TaxID=604196 RepID=A0AAD4HA56_9FUNG|nr:hypothetical protein BGZ95_004264 [Linnemannia exigua]